MSDCSLMLKWSALIAICLGSIFSGCHSSSDNRQEINITMIGKSSTNPVFIAAKNGAEAAARELGSEADVNVNIAWHSPETESGTVQAEYIAQAVDDGADAILISSSDAEAVTPAINRAVTSGVPVMTFDSDAADSARFSYYGPDNTAVGEQVVTELVALVGDDAKIAILAGSAAASNLIARREGALAAAARFSNLEIIGVYNHEETTAAATEKVLSVMNEHPEIEGWAMLGGWPLFDSALLGQLDSQQVKIVALDGLPSELPYVETGLAPVLLAQAVFDWGYLPVFTIVNKLHLDQEPESYLPAQLVRVTNENLGTWARTLKEWGFDDIPERFLVLP